MAITHIKDGDSFFSGTHADTHRSFGFHGSAGADGGPTHQRGGSPPYASTEPTGGPKHVAEPIDQGHDYAHGGHVEHHHPHGHHVVHSEPHHDGGVVHHHSHGGMTIHHADGHVSHHHHDGKEVHAAHGGAMHHMHPHGHHVTRVEHRPHDGAVVHHHHHGGHTVHHKDGRITHHHEDGSPVHMAHGGMEHMHDPESEYVHRAHGGDAAQDKALVRKAFSQHDKNMHHGEHENLHLRRGGGVGMTAPLPRGMRPRVAHHTSPIERAPRNPNLTTTPSNAMPGGQMGYGVQPSAEPDMAGSEQDIPQMRHGGRARHRE